MTLTEEEPTPESIRCAMDHAWRDHHHARDQTWKTIQIEAVLGAGLVTVDAEFGLPLATAAAGALVMITTLFGVLISIHRRHLERRKFIHIMNCEKALGLHQNDLIPEDLGNDSLEKSDVIRDAAVRAPAPLQLLDLINPYCRNTSIFILRMHVAIMLFALIVVTARIWTGPGTGF